MYKKEKFPVDVETLFQQIRNGIQNATVSCEIVTNEWETPSILWAIQATAVVTVGGKENVTVVRQSPWYVEGKLIPNDILVRDIDSLISVIAVALGHKVFINPAQK